MIQMCVKCTRDMRLEIFPVAGAWVAEHKAAVDYQLGAVLETHLQVLYGEQQFFAHNARSTRMPEWLRTGPPVQRVDLFHAAAEIQEDGGRYPPNPVTLPMQGGDHEILAVVIDFFE